MIYQEYLCQKSVQCRMNWPLYMDMMVYGFPKHYKVVQRTPYSLVNIFTFTPSSSPPLPRLYKTSTLSHIHSLHLLRRLSWFDGWHGGVGMGLVVVKILLIDCPLRSVEEGMDETTWTHSHTQFSPQTICLGIHIPPPPRKIRKGLASPRPSATHTALSIFFRSHTLALSDLA